MAEQENHPGHPLQNAWPGDRGGAADHCQPRGHHHRALQLGERLECPRQAAMESESPQGLRKVGECSPLAVICCSAVVSGTSVLERMSWMILLFSHRSARHLEAGSLGSRRRCYVEQRAGIRPLRTLLLSLRYSTSSIYFRRNPWEHRSILPPCLHHPPGQCPCSAISLIRQTSDKSAISPPS